MHGRKHGKSLKLNSNCSNDKKRQNRSCSETYRGAKKTYLGVDKTMTKKKLFDIEIKLKEYWKNERNSYYQYLKPGCGK